MSDSWEPIAEALREELQEYGCLMHLFDEQQEAILRREADRALSLQANVTEQLSLVATRRRRRETTVRECAMSHNREETVTLRELMAYFDEPVRPMLDALIDEINRLLRRAKKRAQQNQMLLARSIETMQSLITRLDPCSMVQTYTPSGQTRMGGVSNRSQILAKG